jgi:hypothetical protein
MRDRSKKQTNTYSKPTSNALLKLVTLTVLCFILLVPGGAAHWASLGLAFQLQLDKGLHTSAQGGKQPVILSSIALYCLSILKEAD